MDTPAPIPAPPAAASEHNDGEVQRMLVRALLENMPYSIYFKDRESRFIAVSNWQASTQGMTPADLIGKCDFDLYAEYLARGAWEDEQRIMRTGIPMLNILQKEIKPDGRVMWTNSSKLPLRDAQGHIVGTFGITHDVTESKELEIALEKSSTELIHTSRLAGMAEVATGVLHNVGNVLNSLNVSATVITAGLRSSKVESLGKVAALLKEHSADLGEYLSHDPKGKMLPEFIEKLAEHFTAERTRLHAEIESLQKNIDHIKDIVAMQQAYAHLAGGVESLDAATLMEDALRMNASALGRHSVHTVRKFQPVPAVRAERAKVLQILVNLIRNAKHALDEGMPPEKTMTVRVELGTPGLVHLVVADNGVGILAENMPRVFERGFTTRKTGHGFGLSSAIAAAREMRGSLTVRSGGYLEGAEFTLALPVADQPVAEKT